MEIKLRLEKNTRNYGRYSEVGTRYTTGGIYFSKATVVGDPPAETVTITVNVGASPEPTGEDHGRLPA